MLATALASCFGAIAPAGSAGARRSACPGANVPPDGANAGIVDGATLCLIDGVRAAHHLPALRANRELGAVAIGQVVSMVRWDYFADVRPSGQTPLSLVVVTRYPAHATRIEVAENIAWGTGADATATHIVAAWMASPPHRRVILDGEYRDAGVAVNATLPRMVGAGQPGATYAMEFGVRRG